MEKQLSWDVNKMSVQILKLNGLVACTRVSLA